MNANSKRNINITTIIALAFISVSASPLAVTQIIVFVSLLGVVFGRDILLHKQSRAEAVT